MNSHQRLEIDQIIDQIVGYSVTEGGKQEVLGLTMLTHRLRLERELNRQKEALHLTIVRGAPSFFGIHNIKNACILASKQGILSIEDLVSISQFGHGIKSLQTYYQKSEIKMNYLNDLFDNLMSDIELSKAIDACFSLDFEVYDKASPTLAKIRKQLVSLDSRINQATHNFIQKNASYLTDTFSSIRSERIVVPVKTSEKHRFKGIIHNQSASGQTTFVEPQVLIDLNNERQSLLVDEHQEIVRICRELSMRVSRISDQYIASYETVCLLDSLFARGKWAKDRDGVVATLSEDIIDLKGARHPLLDQETVVKNNYQMIPPTRLLLITGPNTGGKTVGLKTIGTAIYLSHCGIPVLCDEAVVPFVHHIFVDIGDQQSIQQSLSTFSAHINTLKTIVDKAHEKSLVLLDELGVGTDPLEGESLAQAILERLLDNGTLTVATTHYNRLKLLSQQYKEIMNASVEFDVESLQPTYKFIQGIAGQSYAFDIASKLQLDSSVISRASDLKEQSISQQENLIDDLERQIEQQTKLNEQLLQQREDLLSLEQSLKKQQSDFEIEKDSVLEKFKQEQQLALNEILEEAQLILEELHENQKRHEVLESVQAIKDLAPQEEVVDVKPEDFKVGDMVSIKGTAQIGQITEINKQQASLDVRGLRMQVKLNQLLPHQVKKTKKVKKKRSSVSVSALTPMSLEVNVIGLTVEEAMIEINNYLDQGILNKLVTGRVIHGHGTGALRSATHDLLKRHKAVKSYRLGGENEGGVGATVITFKS